VPQRFDVSKSWRKGEVSRPDLLIARIELENTDQSVKLSRNQRLPSLDIVGDAGYAGAGREFSSAFTQIRRTDYPYYSYGVEMSIPLGNTVARNNYKKAKISREQQALGYKRLEQGVLIEIENAVASGRTSLERTEATRQAALYAEDALKAEQKKLDSGKSTSFQVLDLQSKLTGARTAEIRALADYNIALAAISLAEGSTLERRNVTLKVK
jgi:outer membrane protein TolC